MEQSEQESERINTLTVSSNSLLFYTRAYNQGQIMVEEWLERTVAW
jgi:hypothetical protein